MLKRCNIYALLCQTEEVYDINVKEIIYTYIFSHAQTCFQLRYRAICFREKLQMINFMKDFMMVYPILCVLLDRYVQLM